MNMHANEKQQLDSHSKGLNTMEMEKPI